LFCGEAGVGHLAELVIMGAQPLLQRFRVVLGQGGRIGG